MDDCPKLLIERRLVLVAPEGAGGFEEAGVLTLSRELFRLIHNMHLLMIDESGTPPKPGKAHPSYFVIAGVVIPEATWTMVRDALMGLKIRHRVRGELKWRYFAPGNEDERNPMRKLSQDARDAIRTDIYKIISGVGGMTSLAAVCSASAAYAMSSVNNQEDIYHLTYKVISERFQYFLQDQPWFDGKKPMGTIVSDHRGTQDDIRLRSHHQTLIHSTSGFTS